MSLVFAWPWARNDTTVETGLEEGSNLDFRGHDIGRAWGNSHYTLDQEPTVRDHPERPFHPYDRGG